MERGRGRRVGVFGGTFDPPHVGHLVAARNAVHSLGLDVVLFVVAGEPWQKVGLRAISAAADRVALVEAAVRGLAWADISTVEVDRGGPSYSIDTLGALRDEEPDAELFLLVGVDAALAMPTWERFDEVVGACHVAMIDRPRGDPLASVGAGAPGPGAQVPEVPPWVSHQVHIPLLDISSTELRRRVRDGEPLDYLVPAAVVSVIDRRGLYREVPV